MVAAINRLDGRQYAVKKIKMQSQSPQGFSRLIREVTTLSRLQHPHVVRYFQVRRIFEYIYIMSCQCEATNLTINTSIVATTMVRHLVAPAAMYPLLATHDTVLKRSFGCGHFPLRTDSDLAARFAAHICRLMQYAQQQPLPITGLV